MLYNNHNLSVIKISSKSDARPALASVLFTSRATVATDGYRLLEVTVPAGLKPEDFPKVNGVTAMRGCEPFLVPAKGVKEIKIPKNKELPILNNIAIKHVDKDKAQFLISDQVVSLRRIDDKFPDYEQLFPTGEPVAEIKINGKWLADLLDIMAGVSGATADVTLKFYAKNKPLVLEAGNPDQKARGLIMEIRT